MSPLRRLSFALLRRAVATLPPARHEWGAAMLTELDEIPGDLRAFAWTFGAVRASTRLRREAVAQTIRFPVVLQWTLRHAWLAVLVGVLGYTARVAYLSLALPSTDPVMWDAALGLQYSVLVLVPGALMLGVGSAFASRIVERRAGLRPRPGPHRLMAVAEGVAVAIAVAFVWRLLLSVTRAGAPVMTIVHVVALVSGAWLMLAALLDVYRRAVRRTARREVERTRLAA
jgi:hypothetical protein